MSLDVSPRSTIVLSKRTSPSAVSAAWGASPRGVESLTPDYDITRAPSRRSTGKRLRFEVFKRDYFTCRYCGAQPPDVVLVVDHVLPVASGGLSSPDNLVTACEACNQGKTARLLGDALPRVDADLMYLTAQQEIAEIRRYQQALLEREAALASLVGTMQDLWVNESGLDWHPGDTVLKPLLRRYAMDVVGAAIVDVATKVASGYVSSYNNHKWVAYLHAVCRNMASEADDDDGA